MKKYLIYILVSLVVIFASLFIVEIYKNKYANYSETQNKVEELQKKVSKLENNNIEQSQAVEGLRGEIVQMKDEQIKKLEDSISELQTKTSDAKQLESRISVAEKNISSLKVSVWHSAGTAYMFGKAMDATAKLPR